MKKSPQTDNVDDGQSDFSELVEVIISADMSGVVLNMKGNWDISFKSGKYYSLENFGNFNMEWEDKETIRCLLIGPETRVSAMSARMAEKRNPGLKGHLRDQQEDAESLLDSLPRSIKLEYFRYDVKETINRLKGESVFI